MNIADAIAVLEERVPKPSEGLPDDLFFYISKTTPLVNVDLLIKDENGRILLAWRNDEYCGKGWHVPGGIVRFKENFKDRIKKVAETEIGVDLQFDPAPIAVNEIIIPERDIRSHFISLLYKCFLPSTFIPENEGHSPANAGYLKWHEVCPGNLLKAHEMYRKYI